MWSECSWVMKIALMLSGDTPIFSSAPVILFALTPASMSMPPSEVPMYMQLPLLEEKSGQNFAMFYSFKKSCAGMTDAGFLHLYF